MTSSVGGGRTLPGLLRGLSALATMGQLALLVGALVGCLLPVRGCIICDPRVVAALDSLDTEYLPTRIAPERHGKVMEMIRRTVRNFKDLPDLEPHFMGAIDDTFVREFSWMLTLEKAAFRGYITRFQREDFCPNKCGTMMQLLIWCRNCKKQLHICRKSRDCGVRQINVHEKEDMILDCELNWHKFSQGLTNYSFYRVWPFTPKSFRLL